MSVIVTRSDRIKLFSFLSLCACQICSNPVIEDEMKIPPNSIVNARLKAHTKVNMLFFRSSFFKEIDNISIFQWFCHLRKPWKGRMIFNVLCFPQNVMYVSMNSFIVCSDVLVFFTLTEILMKLRLLLMTWYSLYSFVCQLIGCLFHLSNMVRLGEKSGIVYLSSKSIL